MKVYLLTFHGSVIYGAVLQAYALYKKISSMGYECEVIDYCRKQHQKNYVSVKDKRSKVFLYKCFHYPKKKSLQLKFNRFVVRNMNLTQESYDGVGALFGFSYDPNDVFVIGSDQVWNCAMTWNNYHYFLDFVETENKFSFASSFGVSSIDDWSDKDRMIEYLRMFRRISVREETGQAILKKYLGKRVDVICDPTFLLNSTDWKKVAVLNKYKEKYICLFLISRNELLEKAVEAYSINTGIRVINIAYSISIPFAHNKKSVSPEEFLGLIHGAEAVFTNSFHGFALSLNFNKQVFVALSGIGRNSRITDLAERLGVSHRIVNEKKDIDSIEPIDYDIVSEKIEEERLKGIEYLEEILKVSDN